MDVLIQKLIALFSYMRPKYAGASLPISRHSGIYIFASFLYRMIFSKATLINIPSQTMMMVTIDLLCFPRKFAFLPKGKWSTVAKKSKYLHSLAEFLGFKSAKICRSTSDLDLFCKWNVLWWWQQEHGNDGIRDFYNPKRNTWWSQNTRRH